VHVVTNDCIEVVDNSIVYDSTTKFVKEIKEYALISEQAEMIENLIVSEQEQIQQPQGETLDQEKIVITEYVPYSEVKSPQIDETIETCSEKDENEDETVKPKQTDQIECQIEDVTHVETCGDMEIQSEPIISLFNEEK